MAETEDLLEPEAFERLLLQRLLQQLAEGNVGAAEAAANVNRRRFEERKAREDLERLQKLKKKPKELCRELGRHGETPTGVSLFLDREMREDELEQFELGRRERQYQVRAAELRNATSGNGPVQPWMRG